MLGRIIIYTGDLKQQQVINPETLKLDKTQVLVDFKRFERTMIWQEFWYGNEYVGSDSEKPFFKIKKNNLSKNYKSPKELLTYLGAVKSEIIDPKKQEQG